MNDDGLEKIKASIFVVEINFIISAN